MIFILFLIWLSEIVQAEPLHIVFDLDWTLVYPLEKAPKNPSKEFVQVEGKWYRIADGAGELLEYLAQQSDVKISFYSGGTKERNLALLEKIRLPSNRSAKEIAHKTLHFEDLTKIENPSSEKFSARYKKDLRKISPDLENVFLIDDIENFTPAGQEKNLLWLGPTYKYEENFREGRIGKPYSAPSQEEWLRERNKLFRVREELERRFSLSAPPEKIIPGSCHGKFQRLLPSF